MSELHKRLFRAIRKHSNMDSSQIMEAAQHGADAGWPGFCYYTDTCAFYEANERDIWELLEDMADSLGQKPLELVASFNVETTDETTLKNNLAWFALEEVGRYLADAKENAA